MKQVKTNETVIHQLPFDVIRQLAFMQYNGEDYFLLTDAKETKAYEGTEADAREQFDTAMEDKEGIIDFYAWCADNLTEVSEFDNDDYYVLTDEEADEKAEQYIKDSLWAFNADFIIQHSKLPYEAEEMVRSFQADKCDSANDTIEALIEDMEEFVKDAISADGRGHFMSSYDGEENEETVDNVFNEDEKGEETTTFYIYRLN